MEEKILGACVIAIVVLGAAVIALIIEMCKQAGDIGVLESRIAENHERLRSFCRILFDADDFMYLPNKFLLMGMGARTGRLKELEKNADEFKSALESLGLTYVPKETKPGAWLKRVKK